MPKTMRPQMGILALVTLLTTISTPIPVNPRASFSSTQVLAQTPNARKAEAHRLLEQGNQQYSISQFEAALQSWQQALIIYREIKDRKGEGVSLGNLGVAYKSLGDYPKAIEYQQQSLAILREIKDRKGEGLSLNNLGYALFKSGNLPKAEKVLRTGGVKTMKIRGILRGKTIELLEALPVPDGLEILIEIPDNLLIERDEKWEQLQAVIGAWKDDDEITEIFDEIDRERHTDLGQPINFDDLN